jgi:hypothetical protein
MSASSARLVQVLIDTTAGPWGSAERCGRIRRLVAAARNPGRFARRDPDGAIEWARGTLRGAGGGTPSQSCHEGERRRLAHPTKSSIRCPLRLSLGFPLLGPRGGPLEWSIRGANRRPRTRRAGRPRIRDCQTHADAPEHEEEALGIRPAGA